MYILTPSGINEKAVITHRFLKRKMDEYEALKVKIEILRFEVGEDHLDNKGNWIQ